MAEKIISVDKIEYVQNLIGSFDENINILQRQYNTTILVRGSDIKISGEEEAVNNTSKAIEALLKLVSGGEHITEQNIRYVISMIDEGIQDKINEFADENVCVTASGKIIKPKTLGQKAYIDSIKKNTIVFGIGPAGTGKTYLAVAMAVKAFRAHDVNKIILTRPAVEAGEKLGFLPGDMQDKVDPYLRPLYDALFETFGAETFQRLQGY